MALLILVHNPTYPKFNLNLAVQLRIHTDSQLKARNYRLFKLRLGHQKVNQSLSIILSLGLLLCKLTFWRVTVSPCIIYVIFSSFTTMRLCHPPDGSTSPKYRLLCFITTKKICKEKNTLAFNRDRCCPLVLCLRLIPFHSQVCFLLTLKTPEMEES